MRLVAIAVLLGVLAGCGRDAGEAPAPAADGKSVDSAAAGKEQPGVARLGLERGYFVRSDLGCADANVDAVHLHLGDRLETAFQSCHFDRIVPGGDNRYEVAETCTDIGTGAVTATRTVSYTVKGPMEFVARDDEGFEFGARFCSQAELPEPWRSVDLTAK
jgi:hypothetical protein